MEILHGGWTVLSHRLWILHMTLGEINMKQPIYAMKWIAPEPSWFKCNTDAAFNTELMNGASGAVVRDDQGRPLGGASKWYTYCLDALSMEAFACKDGMELARTSGIQKLIVQTDCQELVKLCQADEAKRSINYPILQQMRVLSLSFSSFNLVFINRSCNRFAHESVNLVNPGCVKYHDCFMEFRLGM